MKKRVLSLFLALTLCLTLLPTAAFAEGTNGSAISSEAAAAEGGQPTATGAPTEGGGQLTNTGEGEQPNSETDALTEIWFARKPDSIARSYDGTTDGSMVSFGTPQFTDGINTFELTEGTDFTAKKTFDSADAGSRTVTVEIELIGDAAAKYKLKAGEETFTISGTINKAYPNLTVSLTKTTCTVGEKLLPLLSISGRQENAAVTYYYAPVNSGYLEFEGTEAVPAIDENTAISEPGTYYVYAKSSETKNYEEERSETVELTVIEAAVEAASITRADGTDGGTYGSLPAALNAAQDGDTVTMLTTLNDDDTISFCRDAEGKPVEKTVTLMMNGHSLSYEGASPLHIQSGKLIIGDDAAISQPVQAAVPAVFVDNNEQSKDRGTLEFKGKATLTGGLLIQNWGKLVGGLKEGTIITSNGTYSVSVERSIDTYSNVLGLLGEGLAFAKKDKPTELVNGNVKNLTEDVIVVAHTHSPKCTQNPDPDALQTYIYTCDCGFVCPHDRFTNSICDICHAACTHDEYTSDDKCARCGAPFAVRVECTDSVGITSNKLYMKTTTQDGTDDTLRQVFNEAADGSTITLLANGRLPYGIYASKTLTLDLNGHSLDGYSLNVGGSTATGQALTGNLTVIDSRGGNGAVGVTVRDGGTLVFDPENDSTTLLQLEVWGGKVELHGGKILRKDLRLNNSITLGDLLPQKAGLAYYCGDTQLTLKEAASKTCDLVVKSCAHGGKNGFDETATACPYCNAPAVAETALNNGEGSRLLRRFANLQTAIDADRDGGATLQLLADVTGNYTIGGTRDTGLDLNGHCIKGTVTVKAAAGSNTTTFSNTQNTTSVSIDAVVAHRGAKLAGSKYPAVIGKLTLAEGVVCSKRLLNQAVWKSLRTHNLKPKKGAQVMRKNEKITALYERLSRDDFGKDDDQQRESNSISNQKAMLEEFAARQGFTNIVHFTDDGISGTCFDRPGFLAMMKEVEAGNVEYLCIKDMSRMGRDYLKVGQIMEILRQRGVRLIAINDGVDSARGDDDFTPFRNIMNEYYARDTSRKIRSTFQSKGKSGKHLTGTVIYGYLWNEARDQWLVDPEAADVVKRIFAMTIDGYGPYQIASKLKSEKVLIPSAYLAQHGEGVNKNKTFKDVYGWGSSTICNILEKREYLGHTINFKTRKHFKDKKSHYVPEDEWTIFENTHEAIIDQQTFDLVQKIRGNVRRYPDGWGEAAPLTGLLYCADCGGKMYVHRTNNGKRISQYTCSQYSKVPVGKLCKTQHRINEEVVLSLVSEMLKAIAEYAKHDRAEFVRVVQEAQSSQQTAEVKKQRTRLATAKQRVSELEVLLCKIYEDNILGKLSDSRYATLDAQYEKEQTELTAEISVLEKAVKSYEKHEKDADRFIALIDKYENFDKLTIAMLNEFIEKILVHERDRKGSIQTTQEVEIYFNFVGRFVPPAFGEVELTPEQLEEIRKREERKDRLHQNYLKRKARGAQKRYEDKIREKKKAEIDAKKAAIRAEDIAKGVFIPVSSLPHREPQKGAQTA